MGERTKQLRTGCRGSGVEWFFCPVLAEEFDDGGEAFTAGQIQNSPPVLEKLVAYYDLAHYHEVLGAA